MNVGDKVQLISFEEALRRKTEDDEQDNVFGITKCMWDVLLPATGTIIDIMPAQPENTTDAWNRCAIFQVGFERVLPEVGPYTDRWFIPDFALQPSPSPSPEIRVHIKQMGPGYINLELTVYDPEIQQERPATFKETKSYVEQHPDILGFGGWIMGANGVHQCID